MDSLHEIDEAWCAFPDLAALESRSQSAWQLQQRRQQSRWVSHRMGRAAENWKGQELQWRRIRGIWVLRDRDVAMIFAQETRLLNRRVVRASTRFPEDFCFRLHNREFEQYFADINHPERWSTRPPMVYSLAGMLQFRSWLAGEAQLDFLRWQARLLETGMFPLPSSVSLPLCPTAW